MGPPVAALMAFGLVHVIRLAQVRKVIGVHPFRTSLGKSIVAFAVATSFAFLVDGKVSTAPFGGIISGLTFLASYFAAICVLRLEPEERQLVSRLVQRIKRIAHLA